MKFKEIISLKDQNRLIISEIEMNTIGMTKEIQGDPYASDTFAAFREQSV